MGQFSVLEKKVNKMLEFEELLHDVPTGKVEKNEIVGNSAIDEKEKATCADKTTVTEMSDDSVIVITSTPPELILNVTYILLLTVLTYALNSYVLPAYN